jgi:hypothetical protein
MIGIADAVALHIEWGVVRFRKAGFAGIPIARKTVA